MQKINIKALEKEASLRFDKEHTPKNIAELLAYLFIDRKPTYSVTTNRQISKDRPSRSREDVFRLCQTYFPKVTIDQVDKMMQKLHGSSLFQQHFCGTCKRNVFSKNIFYYQRYGQKKDFFQEMSEVIKGNTEG